MAGESRQKSKNDTLRQLSNVASEISIKKLAMALGRTYFGAMFLKILKILDPTQILQENTTLLIL